jgi:hypothetical protein
LLSDVVESSAAKFPSKASGKGVLVETAVLAARWMETVVGLDLLAVLEGIMELIISSSSSSLLDSLRRYSSDRLAEGIRCRCRSVDDDVSGLARTVEVRHASRKKSAQAILKRGVGEFDSLGRIWAVEAGRDVEAIVASERATSAVEKSGRILFMYRYYANGDSDEAVQGSSELAAQTITRLNVFHLDGPRMTQNKEA